VVSLSFSFTVITGLEMGCEDIFDVAITTWNFAAASVGADADRESSTSPERRKVLWFTRIRTILYALLDCPCQITRGRTRRGIEISVTCGYRDKQ
jgi:hypothetical protein